MFSSVTLIISGIPSVFSNLYPTIFLSGYVVISSSKVPFKFSVFVSSLMLS